MVTYLEIKANASLKKSILDQIKEDWAIEGEYSGKPELIQAINGSIEGFDPYIKFYLFSIDNKLVGLSGSKPTIAAKSPPVGISTYVNAFKRDPSKVSKYVNATQNFLAEDLIVNEKLKKVVAKELDFDDLWLLVKDQPAEVVPSEEQACTDQKVPMGLPPQNSKCNTVTLDYKDSKSSTLGKLLKLEQFNEESMSAEDWLLNSSYALDVAGIRDPKIYLSGILSKLPDGLLCKTRAELARREISADQLTFEELKSVLITLTQKSPLEYERKLKNLKYSTGTKMRDFWLKIEKLVKLLNPTVTEPAALNTIVTREFKAKMPSHIQQNVSFKSCPDTDISIATLAATVEECSSGTVDSNALKSSRGGYHRGRGGYRGGQRGGRGANRGTSSFRGGHSANRSSSGGSNQSAKNIECWFCGKIGHFMADCYALKARKNASKAQNSGGRDTENKTGHND